MRQVAVAELLDRPTLIPALENFTCCAVNSRELRAIYR